MLPASPKNPWSVALLENQECREAVKNDSHTCKPKPRALFCILSGVLPWTPDSACCMPVFRNVLLRNRLKYAHLRRKYLVMNTVPRLQNLLRERGKNRPPRPCQGFKRERNKIHEFPTQTSRKRLSLLREAYVGFIVKRESFYCAAHVFIP
jgi:hypothetical protein